MNNRKHLFLIAFLLANLFSQSVFTQKLYGEMHRPQLHFSPKANWMNDPNGLVYYKGTYHLFFQYYPDSTVWGPNFWGHATSSDLLHWTELEPALAPDTLGLIASGSAVVDYKNTSGFGKAGDTPLVAIYAYINQALERKNINAQYQAIAYSLDEGKTWTKYSGNPVIKNPGIRDFRDPKVIWYAPQNKWVMTVATQDHVTYYSSPNLKDWKKESEFGKGIGGHGGVWECPDLFSYDINGKKVWVQVVSINPGGPNGGSATQYFVGDFDGTTFTPYTNDTKWLDYGTDNYAGVTWFNTGDRKIFIGWMSNWQYANVVPTEKWRSAMTVPRELKLVKDNGDYLLASEPVKELNALKKNTIALKNIAIKGQFNLSDKIKKLPPQYQLSLAGNELKDFAITLSNELKEQVVIGYSKAKNEFYIDRTKSGKVDFEKRFAKRFEGPRLSENKNLNIKLIVDAASAELFADNGLTVMTAIFFPTKSFNTVKITSPESFLLQELNYSEMKSIWQDQPAALQQKQSASANRPKNLDVQTRTRLAK